LPAEPVRRLVRYRSVPQDLRPVLDTWDRSFFDWGETAIPAEQGFYLLKRYDNDAAGSVIRPTAPRFAGRVWVIVGPANSSATFEFARAIKLHQLGTLVGQTTGGNRRGITGGAFFFLRLPKSGIELDVPLIGQFAQSPQPDSGIEPDIRVLPTIADIAAGRDSELEAVRDRIREAARQR
ncbi:MAG: S41 family peptidase, partial [Bryobacter sp.]|nr:S41 family peptidase [Bryobacter sp.]